MRDDVASLVHPILWRALDLRRRLLAGEEPSLEAEQAAFIHLLRSEQEARRWPEYGGAPPAGVAAGGGGLEASEEGFSQRPFLGARYALVSWLDELFILDSPWGQHWNEYKLEVRLYASNDRAWKFWEQAKVAADRSAYDALEVYFQCVMLGFTGEWVDTPEQLTQWTTRTRAQLLQTRETTWRSPVGAEVQTRVPPLWGRQAVRRMLLIATTTVLCLVPVVAYVLARRMG